MANRKLRSSSQTIGSDEVMLVDARMRLRFEPVRAALLILAAPFRSNHAVRFITFGRASHTELKDCIGFSSVVAFCGRDYR